MDLRHLRYVVAAARNGSFSAAGHELNVRQPVISKRIRELDDELGVFLFDRATSGARLTRLVRSLSAPGAASTRSSGCPNEPRRAQGARPVASSSGSFCVALKTFRSKFAGVEVELLEASYIELKAGVMSGTIDLAIVIGETCRTELLASLPLWSAQLVMALPEDYGLAEKATIYWPERKANDS